MTQIEFVEKDVNVGRMLSHLRLEELVLADGVLPKSPLYERASLVRGVLDGFLERGRWETALRLVHGNGPVRGLFDGDFEAFHKKVFAVAKGDKEIITRETIKILSEREEYGLLKDLYLNVSFNKECEDKLIEAFWEHTPEEDLRKIRGTMAWRAEEQERYADAIRLYERNKDTVGLWNLYCHLLKKPGPNFECLVKLVDKIDVKDRKRRLTDLVKKALLKPKTIKIDYSTGKELYNLWKEKELKLTRKEQDTILDMYASELHGFEARGSSDKKLAVLWAKKKWKEDPVDAYRVLKKYNQRGKLVIDAAKKGLQSGSDNDKFRLEEISKTHLKEIYKTASTELKIKIAEHLNSREMMRGLSKKLVRSDPQNAYMLWIKGSGDPKSDYIINLRTRLISKDLKDRSSSPYFFFLEQKDKQGHIEAFQACIDEWPGAAYDLAMKIKSPLLIDQARRGMVEANPFESLRRFLKKEKDKDNDDIAGIKLSIDNLSEIYGIPEKEVRDYVYKGRDDIARGY